MKTLYFECGSGISGDMTVAALLDIGADEEKLLQGIASLGVEGYEIKIRKCMKQGVTCTDFTVLCREALSGHRHDAGKGDHTHSQNQHERVYSGEHSGHAHHTMKEIRNLIMKSPLSAFVKERAVRTFEIVAEAESKVHRKPADEVTFHEVGAVDSIIDIVGTALCIEDLAPGRIVFSALCEGTGTQRCAHGVLPVPVPATAEIFKNYAVPFEITANKGEMVTPTGAAIAAAYAEYYGRMPQMKVERIGYGAGKKEFEQANLLRVYYGMQPDCAQKEETIVLLESNIDDSTPEILGYSMEKLLKAGALDVYYTPVFMKKSRPAYKISVLCREEDAGRFTDFLFLETSTIGVRRSGIQRLVMQRESFEVHTIYGNISCKKSYLGSEQKIIPEYDSVKTAAERNGIPFRNVYDCAVSACWNALIQKK